MPATLLGGAGGASFRSDFGISLGYVAGAMAHGIASTQLVAALGQARLLGFFGAAGLPISAIDDAISTLEGRLAAQRLPWGVNFIHQPLEPTLEEQTASLLIRRRVPAVEASAFMELTPSLVWLRCAGLRRDLDGRVHPARRFVAKASRTTLVERFFSPPPPSLVARLVKDGRLTPGEAHCAADLPMADAVTVESDSGGHTDRQPAVTLLPMADQIRRRLQHRYKSTQRLYLGLGGGMSTPQSIAGAFAMGAEFVVGGSVHQSCVEAGTSAAVKNMLCAAGPTDVAMAAAADMFELGVQVQVLKRATLFPMRANHLWWLYKNHSSLEALPAEERLRLEQDYFRMPIAEVWQQTAHFFAQRDPTQVERANRDPRHQMALVFRWYLGQASSWARLGVGDRQVDYQVWCGPSMGAFNAWAQGTALQQAGNRRVAVVAQTLMAQAQQHWEQITAPTTLSAQSTPKQRGAARAKPGMAA